MPNFNNGPVPSPGYGEEANQFSQATEFTDDVYCLLYTSPSPRDPH